MKFIILGRGGWDTPEEWDYSLREGSSFQFDALILSVLELDDFFSLSALPELSDEYLDISDGDSIQGRIIRYFKNHSYAFGFFYAQYLKYRQNFFIKEKLINAGKAAISNEDNWKKFLGYIREIKESCDKNNTEFYIISFPVISIGDDKEFNELAMEYREQFARHLSDSGMKHTFLKK